MKTTLAAIAAAFALAACGGGGGDAPAAPQSTTSAAPPAPAAPTIELFGDSTMRQASFPLAARYGARLTNRAVNGSSSTQLVAGADGLNKPWPQSVAADVAIVEAGPNDGLPSRRITLDAFRANLEVLAVAPARVVFQTPIPSTQPGRDMTDFAHVMREVAAEHGLQVIDVFACFSAAPDYPALLADGMHPNDAGLQVMVACMEPALDAL